jgi:hypothetical protein
MMYVDKCASCAAHNYFSISERYFFVAQFFRRSGLIDKFLSLVLFLCRTDSTSVIITSNSPSKSNHNGVGETNADVSLVYPFVYDAEIKKAAMQLSLCDYRFSVNKDYVKLQCEKAVGRNHIVTITRRDWNSLQSQSFVNDAIIEFWLQAYTKRSVMHWEYK